MIRKERLLVEFQRHFRLLNLNYVGNEPIITTLKERVWKIYSIKISAYVYGKRETVHVYYEQLWNTSRT